MGTIERGNSPDQRVYDRSQYFIVENNIDKIIQGTRPFSPDRSAALENLTRDIGQKKIDIDKAFHAGVEAGVPRDEALVRREASKLLISTNILLARASFTPPDQYLPGIDVAVYHYPGSDRSYHPLSANRVDIFVPNSNPNAKDPLVLTTQIVNLVPHIQTAQDDQSINSVVVAEKFLDDDHVKVAVESEEDFIMRRSYEIARIGSLQAQYNNVAFRGIKQMLCVELLDLWAQRKISGRKSENVELLVGDGFVDRDNQGMLELKIVSNNGRVVKFRMPRLEILRSNPSVLKAMKAVRRTGNRFDYTALAEDRNR